ncbi:MAG: hypothetical protein KC501_05200 [Myxococcales bacterium]|nr:hypothetical protein [Myxococcales bacterium]
MKVARMISRGALLLPLLGGCGDDGDAPPNMLPTASASGTDTGNGAGSTDTGTPDDTGTTEGGGGPSFPTTYRFDCVDIIDVGDSDGDGVADGNSIQATLLENTWASDIDNFKLNIMLTVRERDDAAGTATIAIGSGIGTGLDDQCVEPSTASMAYQASYDPDAAQWQPGGDGCAEPAAGAGFGGTYTFELGASDTIYIYAQDDDGTTFNCVPGGAAPNAVPLHAISATVTVDANDQISAGELSGCLLESEAQGLCSCLGECMGGSNPGCEGCPDGSTPLSTLLGGVMPTDNCTTIMGATAFDLRVGFTTRRLPVDEPAVCGG